jgi:Tfp pilus assembly protein FimT
MRPAHTLYELILTLSLLSLVTAMAVPPIAAATVRWQVRAAVTDVVNALVLTREAALTRGTVASFVVNASRGEVTVTCGGDTIARRAIGALHGVTLAASGDSVRYAPDGLATGVSNTTLLIVRGARVDSVVVSRLGRVRWTE